MHNISIDTLRQAALLVTTPQCFDTYFMDFDFFNGPCFSATLSKCLGLAIILGSLMVKLPQIIKIVSNKSGQGISLLSVTLDLMAMTIYTVYSFRRGFPFSAWGDASFLAVQTVAIGCLVLAYDGRLFQAMLYFHVFAGVMFILGNQAITPLHLLWSLQGCNIFIAVMGKLVQAYSNYCNGHTGQLSAITLLLMQFGSLARIFTSVQETGDNIVILTYIASSLANGIVVAQLFYYWNAVPVSKKIN